MSETDTLGLAKIGQIAVNVHDLERAVAFYRDVLGMPFLFSVPKMAFFRCGDVRLMLAVPETPELDHPASIIYYRVDDIRAAHAALGGRGVVFETEPTVVHETEQMRLWMAFFRDPEGNVLALMSEESKA
jgi:catechol 2,3-dioxygenase-like lactoylglutathione lyase family enzyme